MLVLFRPNGVTSFMRTLCPFQITTTRLSWKRGCCILTGYASSFIPHARDSSMAPTSPLFIVLNISPRTTRDDSMTLSGRSVGVLPVTHLIHLLC